MEHGPRSPWFGCARRRPVVESLKPSSVRECDLMGCMSCGCHSWSLFLHAFTVKLDCIEFMEDAPIKCFPVSIVEIHVEQGPMWRFIISLDLHGESPKMVENIPITYCLEDLTSRSDLKTSCGCGCVYVMRLSFLKLILPSRNHSQA